jgi:iron(III) transport system substrate-binding protein
VLISPHRLSSSLAFLALLSVVLFALAGCGGDDGESITIYSGRTESLIQPLLEQFAEDTGIDVKVRYGDTAELAATILEEGDNSPADIFFSQDAGALGALSDADMLKPLPEDTISVVPEQFRSPDDLWVGTSGRSRVVAYNTEVLSPEDLPDSIEGFTDPTWKGRIGWAPTNGSFQAFVTALRLMEGEDGAREWLEGIEANDPTDYPNNVTAIQGVADGEVDVAFVNHYYLHQFLAEQGEDFPVRNHYMSSGDPGALVNVAGIGVLSTSDKDDDTSRFVEFMLQPEAQAYFADETFEYPLIEGVPLIEGLVPFEDLHPPDIVLSDLSDLEGTLELLRDTGVLP